MFTVNFLGQKDPKSNLKLTLPIRSGLLFLFFFFSFFSDVFSKEYLPEARISILQIVDHPALNRTRDGIKDGLAKEGFKVGGNLILEIQSAQGNPAIAAQIAQKFVSDKADIVVALGTTAAQAAKAAAKGSSVVIVFSSITDPLSAKLVESWENPGENISGISNFVPVRPRFEFFRTLLPRLNSLGIVYNPGDANSLALLQEMEETAKEMGIELKTATASKTSEVFSAAQNLASKVDALFINNDNTALAAFDSVVRAGNMAQKPVFVSDLDVLEQGALASLGPDQYELGLQTAQMITRILKNPSQPLPPVESAQKIESKVNDDQAKKLKILLQK